jgi:cytidylate kinase
MFTYYFYNKLDSKKEIIDQIQAKDLETAVTYFTQRKNLSKDKFFELYGVGIKNLK